MITKIQKLSAIHNYGTSTGGLIFVVYDYKDTKIVSNSQRGDKPFGSKGVVYDYKDTKIVSNSQHRFDCGIAIVCCLWLQRYKNCQQFTTRDFIRGLIVTLFMITKIQKLSAIHNYGW